jgi:hypothetical protein
MKASLLGFNIVAIVFDTLTLNVSFDFGNLSVVKTQLSDSKLTVFWFEHWLHGDRDNTCNTTQFTKRGVQNSKADSFEAESAAYIGLLFTEQALECLLRGLRGE